VIARQQVRSPAARPVLQQQGSNSFKQQDGRGQQSRGSIRSHKSATAASAVAAAVPHHTHKGRSSAASPRSRRSSSSSELGNVQLQQAAVQVRMTPSVSNNELPTEVAGFAKASSRRALSTSPFALAQGAQGLSRNHHGHMMSDGDEDGHRGRREAAGPASSSRCVSDAHQS
jgi:hypothetical protein